MDSKPCPNCKAFHSGPYGEYVRKMCLSFDPEAPCVICDRPVYALSMGGPGVCPSCDAGIDPGKDVTSIHSKTNEDGTCSVCGINPNKHEPPLDAILKLGTLHGEMINLRRDVVLRPDDTEHAWSELYRMANFVGEIMKALVDGPVKDSRSGEGSDPSSPGLRDEPPVYREGGLRGRPGTT